MSKNKTKKPKKGFSICSDCGAEYMTGRPHMMFCEAHTCEDCGSSFGHVIEKDGDGRRVCGCQNPEEE